MGLVYYIIDVETNGLKVKHHEITQISIIRCSDLHQINRYIKAEFPWRTSPESLIKTGRIQSDILKGKNKLTAVKDINSFLFQDSSTPEHRCMVAHNASFDKNFCYDLWESLGLHFPGICWLDTKPFAKAYSKRLGLQKPSLTLSASMEFCGLKERPGRHNAIVDVQNLFILFQFLKTSKIDYLPFIKRYPHE